MAHTSLERSSHISLYQQIARHIQGDIQHGRLRPFQKLPSEAELMTHYGVSRVTVRQAIDLLVEGGLVRRKHGKGTFVSGPALNHELGELRGIYETIEATGLALRTRLLDFAAEQPPKNVCALLGPQERLMRLKRLYYVNDVPLGLIVCWLPPGAEEFSFEEVDATPIYGLLRRMELDVNRADLTIKGRVAGRRLGRLLGCQAGAPLLVMERISYGAAELAREVTTFFVHSDGYRFSLSLQGPMPLARNIRIGQ
jgi:GntR family transcriptional regulator